MKNKLNKWFTLIEVIIWTTLFSIMIISIISTLILNVTINNQVDISRIMKENINNTLDQINSHTINTQNKLWIINSSWNCVYTNFSQNSSNTLCINENWEDIKFFLWKYDSFINQWIKVSDISKCDFNDNLNWKINCSLVISKNNNVLPITNDWVNISNLEFNVTSSDSNINSKKPQRVSINFESFPALKKWIKSKMIKNNKIIFQTTLAQRIYQYQ